MCQIFLPDYGDAKNDGENEFLSGDHDSVNIGRPPPRWRDDLRKTAGREWMPQAEDEAKWRTSMSCSGLQYADIDDDIITLFRLREKHFNSNN